MEENYSSIYAALGALDSNNFVNTTIALNLFMGNNAARELAVAHDLAQTMDRVTAYSQTQGGTIMDEVDFIEEQLDMGAISADEKMRLKVAFGDNVAQRFLVLRGITNEVMQEAVLERHANREAARITRDVIALALSQSAQ